MRSWLAAVYLPLKFVCGRSCLEVNSSLSFPSCVGGVPRGPPSLSSRGPYSLSCGVWSLRLMDLGVS